jgi:hypothetical protein
MRARTTPASGRTGGFKSSFSDDSVNVGGDRFIIGWKTDF